MRQSTHTQKNIQQSVQHKINFGFLLFLLISVYNPTTCCLPPTPTSQQTASCIYASEHQVLQCKMLFPKLSNWQIPTYLSDLSSNAVFSVKSSLTLKFRLMNYLSEVSTSYCAYFNSDKIMFHWFAQKSVFLPDRIYFVGKKHKFNFCVSSA